MMQTARRRPVLVGALAAAVAAAVGFAAGTASADPMPPPPLPTPVTAPAAVAPNALAQHSPAAGSSTAQPSGPAAVQPTIQPTLVPATSGTLREYFDGKGVTMAAQHAQGFDALDITLPVPTGWTQVPDPNVPDAFVVIADRAGEALYTSNAQLVVYKLVGDFDPHEAITHGNVESQQLPAWRTTSASMADFGGFPSSMIEGTFVQNNRTLNTSRRQVIATSGSGSYLVSLEVTTAITLAVADAGATDAIVNGFRVLAPSAAGTAAGVAPTAAGVAPAAEGVAPAAPAPVAAAPVAPVGQPAQPALPAAVPTPNG